MEAEAGGPLTPSAATAAAAAAACGRATEPAVPPPCCASEMKASELAFLATLLVSICGTIIGKSLHNAWWPPAAGVHFHRQCRRAACRSARRHRRAAGAVQQRRRSDPSTGKPAGAAYACVPCAAYALPMHTHADRPAASVRPSLVHGLAAPAGPIRRPPRMLHNRAQLLLVRPAACRCAAGHELRGPAADPPPPPPPPPTQGQLGAAGLPAAVHRRGVGHQDGAHVQGARRLGDVGGNCRAAAACGACTCQRSSLGQQRDPNPARHCPCAVLAVVAGRRAHHAGARDLLVPLHGAQRHGGGVLVLGHASGRPAGRRCLAPCAPALAWPAPSVPSTCCPCAGRDI